METESLYKTNTVIKVKVQLFAMCQQWFKLHILHSHHDGLVLVYRPQGERYNPQYMSTCKRSGCVSVHCWGWISHEGAGVLHHTEGHLDGLQYQHILQNVMVPSVQMLYPDGIIHLQQDQVGSNPTGGMDVCLLSVLCVA